MRDLLRDIQFAVRTLRRRRSFTAVALITLALGVGASTSIYSVVDGILFRPLPLPESARLTAVWQTYPQWLKEPILRRMWDRIPLSIPEYRDWRATQHAFTDVAITGGTAMMLGDGESRELVRVSMASASLLDVLGVKPALGRFFADNEDVLGGAPVTVLSYENWQARYGGDPHVLGQQIHFDQGTYTIIGVLPRRLSLQHGAPADPFWIPVGQDSSSANERGQHSFSAIARLKPGVTLAAAVPETEAILRGDKKASERGVRVEQWQRDLTRDVRKPLLLLLAAVTLLLLIACVNVATLLLGEAGQREHEIAARVALGADRWRLTRQLLTESVVLSGAGGAIGAALAFGGTKILVALAPERIPGLADVRIDVRVLAFALTLAIVTGILFGLGPALALARRDPASVLRGGRGQTGRRGVAVQPMLVALELSLSLMLLVGAGLLTRSLLKLTAIDPGFRTENLLAVRVSLPQEKSRDTLYTRYFYGTAAQRIALLPGVVTATASTFTGDTNRSSV